jgi:glycosyltransferase involved in cell wall biosynthesis
MVHVPNLTLAVASVARRSRSGYYLYFGRLSREKGLMTLLQAWRQLPGLRLIVAGTGELAGVMEEFICAQGLQNVTMAGHRSPDELRAVIDGAKFTLAPSEWYETFGLNIVESMVCGIPVIGANIGAIPELIVHGDTGLLFESKNIVSLLDAVREAENLSGEAYAAMSDRVKRHALRTCNKDRYCTSLLDIYRSVLRETMPDPSQSVTYPARGSE